MKMYCYFIYTMHSNSDDVHKKKAEFFARREVLTAC